jgi:plasmid stability protein
MHFACATVPAMAHIQIRNVPDDLHRLLKTRAAKAGMSLSEYLLAEIRRSAEVPTMDEWLQRVRARKLVRLRTRAADLIREDRDSR